MASGKDYFNSLLSVMDFAILGLNIIESVAKLFLVDDYFNEETDWGISIKILKALRIFRILYNSKLLEPLNEMVFAFVKTFE